jgi:hypothetical protein
MEKRARPETEKSKSPALRKFESRMNRSQHKSKMLCLHQINTHHVCLSSLKREQWMMDSFEVNHMHHAMIVHSLNALLLLVNTDVSAKAEMKIE